MVYQAVQRTTKRKVAIKVLLEGPYASESARKRFGHEIELVAQLRHPNIITIFHSGTTPDKRPFYVMDYVHALPLQQHVREKKLTLEEALKLFADVCNAVQHAHQKGVIHRDLKPTNILVDADGTPKVMDFGLAKLLAGPVGTLVSISQEIVGTLPYMSPEQARGDPDEIDTRTDIYSLGVILYELLTGHYPYPVVGQIVEVLKHVTGTEPASPSRTWKSDSGITRRSSGKLRAGQCPIDDEVQTIVLKTLSKERERRYQSAGELARDIGHYLAREPIEAKRDSGWYILRKRLHKYRTPLAMTCAMLLLLAGLAVGAYVRIAQERTAAVAAREEADELRERAENEADNARREAEANRRALYFNRIALADAEYRRANISHVKRLLAACPADLRGWGWYRLRQVYDQITRTLRGHTNAIHSAAFSPDGSLIVSGSHDKTIRTWDTATGKHVLTISGHKASVRSVAFSRDGRRIVSGSWDRTVRVWDARSGEERLVLTGHDRPVTSAAFGPQDRRIVTTNSDYTIRVWDATTGDEPWNVQGLGDGGVGILIASTVFTPDGKRVVSSRHDGTIRLWDAATGEPDRVLRKDDSVRLARFMSYGPGYGGSVACSADGRRIVTAGGVVLDLSTGELLASVVGHRGPTTDAAISPDGRRIATASFDRTLKLRDVPSGREEKTLRGHTLGAISSVEFSPDGRWLLSAGEDFTIKLWDLAASPEVMTLTAVTENSNPNAVAFGPRGKRIAASAKSGVVTVWDVSTGQEQLILKADAKPLESVVFSRDGTRIAAGGDDENVRVWDAVTGQELLNLSGHAGGVNSVAFGPAGGRIVSGGDDRLVKVWSASTGEPLLTLRGHTGEVWSVAFSPTGGRIASAGRDNTIVVWDAVDGAKLLTLEGHAEIRVGLDNGVETVAFSPDGGRIVSGGTDNVIKVWDAVTGQELMTLSGRVAFDIEFDRTVRNGHLVLLLVGVDRHLADVPVLRLVVRARGRPELLSAQHATPAGDCQELLPRRLRSLRRRVEMFNV